jgi:hypothetical protein
MRVCRGSEGAKKSELAKFGRWRSHTPIPTPRYIKKNMHLQWDCRNFALEQVCLSAKCCELAQIVVRIHQHIIRVQFLYQIKHSEQFLARLKKLVVINSIVYELFAQLVKIRSKKSYHKHA